MAYHYTTTEREADPYALPSIETFQLTAHEVAERMEDAQWEMRRRFPLASMNSRDRERMLDAIVEEHGVTGGWFYWFCFPGCLPDGEPMGPFATEAEALADAREGLDDCAHESETTANGHGACCRFCGETLA